MINSEFCYGFLDIIHTFVSLENCMEHVAVHLSIHQIVYYQCKCAAHICLCHSEFSIISFLK